MNIRHPFYDLVEDENRLDEHAVEGVTVNAALESGIDAKVIMMGRPKAFTIDFPIFGGELTTTDMRPRPVQFYVAVRELMAGPSLGPRDEQVMMWLTANGWDRAVEAAEARWLELHESGELQEHARRVATAREVEAARRRVEDASAPGYWDEFVNQGGDVLQGLYAALREGAGKLATVAKWGVGIWLGSKVLDLLRGK